MYIKRDLEGEISKYFSSKEIIAVVGARQCGKTTMIDAILSDIEKKGKRISRVSFDSIKELQMFEDDTDSFVKIYVDGYDILFIDEVQYSKESGKKLKYIYDKFKIKIIISGSSVAELSIQSLKYLVGRVFVFILYPFSFREFIRAKEPRLMGLYEQGNYKDTVLSEMNNHLKEFLLYGGYPGVVLADSLSEKQTILKNIYNTYLLKEIREILDLSNDYRLVSLVKSLSLQIGGILNYNELSSQTGFSYRELKNHLNILEKTFICRLLLPFQTNKRTELVKSPKIYFYDLGFRNISLDNFSSERADIGSMHENFIFLELVKNNFSPKYWRTKSGAEVDFVIEDGTIPIEIKSNLSGNKLTRSFYSFIEKYEPKRGYVSSLNFEDKKKIGKCEVIFAPFLKLIGELHQFNTKI